MSIKQKIISGRIFFYRPDTHTQCNITMLKCLKITADLCMMMFRVLITFLEMYIYDEVIKYRFKIEIHCAEQKKTSFKLDSSLLSIKIIVGVGKSLCGLTICD